MDLKEKKRPRSKDGVVDSSSGEIGFEPSIAIGEIPRESFWTRLGISPRSFQRRTGIEAGQLNHTLKPRHLHMIAIGGSIGAGLFVGSGNALRLGGPAALLIDFSVVGIMIFNVVYALGELAVMFPVNGGFYTYSARFIDPSWGFAMGYNYFFQWAIVLPLELTVAGLTVQYWQVDVSIGVWITVFLVAIILVNVCGVLGYAEEEFWSALLKLIAMVTFMIIGVVLVFGGGPAGGKYDEFWGARLWHDPTPFRNGFKGISTVFVTAAFAYSGTELVGLAAAESENPAKALPGAIKQVFWRITVFYVLGLLFIGLLVSADDPRLLGSGALIDVSTSPFVIVAKDAGLVGFDSFMNVVILVSVISIGNSGVYGGSRTLTALAEQGYAPSIFAYVDRAGRPLISTILILAFGGLAYISLSASGPVVFEWMLALSGLAALFTWGSICVAHIRFRSAWKLRGHSVEEIPFKAFAGVYGSWLGLALVILVLLAQFYTAVSPIIGTATAQSFFKVYLAAPVVLAFWALGYAWKRKGWLRTSQIDVDTGRREVDWDAIRAFRTELARMPAWKRLLYQMF